MRNSILICRARILPPFFALVLFVATNATAQSFPPNFYKPKVDFTTGTMPSSVAIGDVDGDGKPDLVIANSSSNTISVFRNTSTSGSISASSFAAKVDFATGSYSHYCCNRRCGWRWQARPGSTLTDPLIIYQYCAIPLLRAVLIIFFCR